MSIKKTKTLSFVDKAYSIDYMLKNPPQNSKGLKYVWQAAVIEYMKSEGVDLSNEKVYQKPIQGIDFSKIMRNFNSLSGKKTKTTKKAS